MKRFFLLAALAATILSSSSCKKCEDKDQADAFVGAYLDSNHTSLQTVTIVKTGSNTVDISCGFGDPFIMKGTVTGETVVFDANQSIDYHYYDSNNQWTSVPRLVTGSFSLSNNNNTLGGSVTADAVPEASVSSYTNVFSGIRQ